LATILKLVRPLCLLAQYLLGKMFLELVIILKPVFRQLRRLVWDQAHSPPLPQRQRHMAQRLERLETPTINATLRRQLTLVEFTLLARHLVYSPHLRPRQATQATSSTKAQCNRRKTSAALWR
jgi:hypothetical protein